MCRKPFHIHLHVSNISSSPRDFNNFFRIMVADLEPAGCNSTKNELEIKFPNVVLKISQSYQEKPCNEVPF